MFTETEEEEAIGPEGSIVKITNRIFSKRNLVVLLLFYLNVPLITPYYILLYVEPKIKEPVFPIRNNSYKYLS